MHVITLVKTCNNHNNLCPHSSRIILARIILAKLSVMSLHSIEDRLSTGIRTPPFWPFRATPYHTFILVTSHPWIHCELSKPSAFAEDIPSALKPPSMYSVRLLILFRFSHSHPSRPPLSVSSSKEPSWLPLQSVQIHVLEHCQSLWWKLSACFVLVTFVYILSLLQSVNSWRAKHRVFSLRGTQYTFTEIGNMTFEGQTENSICQK